MANRCVRVFSVFLDAPGVLIYPSGYFNNLDMRSRDLFDHQPRVTKLLAEPRSDALRARRTQPFICLASVSCVAHACDLDLGPVPSRTVLPLFVTG